MGLVLLIILIILLLGGGPFVYSRRSEWGYGPIGLLLTIVLVLLVLSLVRPWGGPFLW